MKADRGWTPFLAAFALALILYAGVYSGIEYLRTRKGPWEITFGQFGNDPGLTIRQTRLGISNVCITFPGQRTLPTNETVIFAQPRPVPYDVPMGKCVFMDTTFLPGTVTLQIFGHEIELLPRVLTIDQREYPWKSGGTFDVQSAKIRGQ